MSMHYRDQAREESPTALPDVEVFYLDHDEACEMLSADDPYGEPYEPTEDMGGWYYWPCFPGCLPDGPASGPFETEEAALEAAREE